MAMPMEANASEVRSQARKVRSVSESMRSVKVLRLDEFLEEKEEGRIWMMW